MENKNLNGQKFKNIVYCHQVEHTLIFISILGVQVYGITSIEVNPKNLKSPQEPAFASISYGVPEDLNYFFLRFRQIFY